MATNDCFQANFRAVHMYGQKNLLESSLVVGLNHKNLVKLGRDTYEIMFLALYS